MAYFDFQCSSSKVRITYAVSQSIANNTSTISITDIGFINDYWSGVNFFPDWKIYINGTLVFTSNYMAPATHIWSGSSTTEYVSLKPYSGGQSLPVSTTITHASDGSHASVSLEIRGNNYNSPQISGYKNLAFTGSTSASIALSTIPRQANLQLRLLHR